MDRPGIIPPAPGLEWCTEEAEGMLESSGSHWQVTFFREHRFRSRSHLPDSTEPITHLSMTVEFGQHNVVGFFQAEPLSPATLHPFKNPFRLGQQS